MTRSDPRAALPALVLLGLVGPLTLAGGCAASRPVARSAPPPPESTRAQATTPDAATPRVVPAAARPAARPAADAARDDAPLVFAAVGDIMLGSTFPDETGGALPPNDGADLLAEVAPVLRAADVAFGNLEGPLVDDGVSRKCGPVENATPRRRGEGRRARRRPKKRTCYAFRVPARYGRHLADAGFDVMSLANNHAMDFGDHGRASSRRVLDELGIAHSGEPGDVARLVVRGRRLSVIAFATYAHSMNLNHLEEARALVAEERRRADLVVVSFHGGAEGAGRERVPHGAEVFHGENRGDLRTFARAMIDAGAALVVGHGPHVVRGMEIYEGRLIAYSLGNFATYGGFNLRGPSGLSMILEVRLAPDGAFLGGRVHAAKQLAPGGPRLDPTGEVIGVLRRLSIEDFGAAAPSIADDGTLAPPAGVARARTDG